MAYTKALGKAVAKYDREHYKKITVKVPLAAFEAMKQCDGYENTNQYINRLILDSIENNGRINENECNKNK